MPRSRPRPNHRRPRQTPQGRAPESRTIEAVIGHLGARGDGVFAQAGETIYVAGALPGERVRGVAHGDRVTAPDILEPSLHRVDPPCPHFGACGGCRLQHLAPDALSDWKRDQVVHALDHRALGDCPVTPTHRVPAASRRRVTLSYRRDRGNGARIGFQAHRSHEFVACDSCAILTPSLARHWTALEAFAGALAAWVPEGQIHVLASLTGLDLDLRVGGAVPDGAVTIALTEAAQHLDAARLSVDGERLLEWRAPEIAMGSVRVTPPPGGFLQPSAEGQAVLAALVTDGLKGRGPVADLFAGCGTFALSLAPDHVVHAVEHDASALAALEKGFRFGDGLKPVTTERRDLMRRPLTAKELVRFDAVVMDPPRAGAQAQALEIAQSAVSRVMSVSCNPASFSRDARILVDGGFTLEVVHPVDQFIWSTHIECVGIFSR